MATDLFSQAMAFVWRRANDGSPYHTDPHDPGGETSWGVTFETWMAWQQKRGEPSQVDTFMTLPKEDFLPLYQEMFWERFRCGEMGPIGIAVMDAAVMSDHHAVGFLQHCLGAKVDDEIGPVTLAALQKADPIKLAHDFCIQRETFYAKIPTARYFERGWDRRAEACRDYVLPLLGHAPAALPEPPSAPTPDQADVLNAAELAHVENTPTPAPAGT